MFVKSECELQYDRFVVSNLCHAVISAEERASLMLDFLSSREDRYDQLCEHVYLQAIGEAQGQSLWLSSIGESYLATSHRLEGDLCLIPAQNQTSLNQDTSVQTQLVCNALENALQNMGITVR